MKKLAILFTLIVAVSSCADQSKRQNHLMLMYPSCKVEPATGLIQRDGLDFIVIDTTGQIVAVSFYPFSETKILNIRNIR